MNISPRRICDYLYLHKKLLIALIAAFVLLVYHAASSWVDRIGFPLDDAWIHQTYARNFAQLFEWSFIPGQLSAGSTSPLWTVLLAPGYWMGSGPFFWTFFLGWLVLTCLGWTGMGIMERILPNHSAGEVAAGLIIVAEWRLVWAAASGMETLLFALLIFLVFFELVKDKPEWQIAGLLTGICIWIRPDGVTLVGPVILTLVMSKLSWKEMTTAGLKFIAGLLLLAIPYLFFNFAISGAWWPNTFFAKQAEYSTLRQLPLIVRFSREASLLLIGVGAVLLPGFLLLLIRSVRQRNWGVLSMAIWMLGFVMVYAIRLPVTYQHGRYLIPATPVYFLLGLTGLIIWFKPDEPVFWKRIVGRVWVFSCGFVLCSFLILGARTYANDVGLINSEMVDASQWIAENTDEVDLIAAHDIGALGYYGNRRILDLAGLITPEVIPFIRDENRIAELINMKGARYLMTFPGWYPQLSKHGSVEYCTDGIFSGSQGGENMCIYRFR